MNQRGWNPVLLPLEEAILRGPSEGEPFYLKQ